jgi:four helix bundle protein
VQDRDRVVTPDSPSGRLAAGLCCEGRQQAGPLRRRISMAQTLVAPNPALASVPRQVTPDCERLDAYRVAVEFQILAASIGSSRRLGALRDQLDRASVSIVLNIAEGSGRFTPAEKAHFYLIARGSAMECLAAVSLLQARSLVTPDLYRRSRSLLTRVVAMLTRLATAMRRRAATGTADQCVNGRSELNMSTATSQRPSDCRRRISTNLPESVIGAGAPGGVIVSV